MWVKVSFLQTRNRIIRDRDDCWSDGRNRSTASDLLVLVEVNLSEAATSATLGVGAGLKPARTASRKRDTITLVSSHVEPKEPTS